MAKKIMRHASGLKAQRQNLARRAQNFQVRSRLRTLTNGVLKAISAKDLNLAKSEFIKAQSEWSKASHRGIFHSNASSRTISRLALRISEMAKS